jgi:hypothetical protein
VFVAAINVDGRVVQSKQESALGRSKYLLEF